MTLDRPPTGRSSSFGPAPEDATRLAALPLLEVAEHPPDGSGAVYMADQEVDNQFELYLLYFRLWGDGFETGDAGRWSDVGP